MGGFITLEARCRWSLLITSRGNSFVMSRACEALLASSCLRCALRICGCLSLSSTVSKFHVSITFLGLSLLFPFSFPFPIPSSLPFLSLRVVSLAYDTETGTLNDS